MTMVKKNTLCCFMAVLMVVMATAPLSSHARKEVTYFLSILHMVVT
jgi:hypothetical protein